MFAWLFMGAVMSFLAVGTFSKILVWSNKADTAVDTTVVSHRLKSSEGANPFLGRFKGIKTGIWENLRESVESTIR